MPLSFSINQKLRIIEEKWTGTVTVLELREFWRGYLADPEVMSIRRTLVDLRESAIAFFGPELDDLVRSEVVPRLNGLDWKTAIVVSNPEQFGVSRQYQVFAERYSKDAIFYDVGVAQAWLTSNEEQSEQEF